MTYWFPFKLPLDFTLPVAVLCTVQEKYFNFSFLNVDMDMKYKTDGN